MSTASHEAQERVRLPTKLFYGLGSVAEGTKNTAFNVFLLFYYNQVLGLSGTLAGAAIFVALCFDAITDPLMGSLSDDTRTRWGRRHPYMYASALPMAVCFFFLFNPPAGLAGDGLFAWLCVFAIGVRVSMTLYSIPSNAMIPEITSHYDERTTLVSYRFLFGWTGGLATSIVAYQYFFAPSADFSDGRLDPAAYGAFAFFCAVVILLAILSCALGTHHLIRTFRTPPDTQRFSPRRFIAELRNALSNPSYRMLVIGSLFAAVAGGFNDVVGLYVNTYFWEFDTDQITVIVLSLFLGVIAAFIITRPLSERFDKKTVALFLATGGILFAPLPIFLRLLGLMPENGDPLLLWLITGHAVTLVAAVVSIGILISSMIADAVDENELVTGERQEGVFFSAIAFTTKATSGIGTFVAGIALDVIAFPTQAAPGTVSDEKIFALGFAVGPLMMVLYLLTLVFLARYRITRARHGEILEELARRQEAADISAG